MPVSDESIRDLIARGESMSVEFKSEASSPLSDEDLVEAVVCLANRVDDRPGWLLLGIEDDGRISGARPRHAGGSTDPLRVQALVSSRTRPSHSTLVQLATIEGFDVVAIEVPAASNPIGTADGKYLRRVIGGDGRPSCAPYHFHEMQSVQSGLGRFDYSTLDIAGVERGDLDPLEIARFRRAVSESQGRGDSALLHLDDLDFLKALGAVRVENGNVSVRALGVLLFGKTDVISSAVPTHEVAFQEISGTTVLSNEIWRWPLLRSVEEVFARVKSRSREQEFFVGATRIAIADFPEPGVREGLANALVHRDYTQAGAVHVQLRDDRLIISNPGGFPRGVRIDNLLSTAPAPRNLLLADAFKRAGLVERTSRGINSIYYESLRSGHGPPDYERSTEAGVVLSMFGPHPDTAFARLAAEEAEAGNHLASEQLLILHALTSRREIAIREAARITHQGAAETERVLGSMELANLVESETRRRGTTFRLSAVAQSRLGCLGQMGPGRTSRAQFSRTVLAYVEGNGSISRRDAARICGLSPHRAYRLLNGMAAAGELERVGARGRAVHYVKPGRRTRR